MSIFLEYHVQSHLENIEKVNLVILFPDAQGLVALGVLVGEQAGMLLLMDNRQRSSSTPNTTTVNVEGLSGKGAGNWFLMLSYLSSSRDVLLGKIRHYSDPLGHFTCPYDIYLCRPLHN